LSSPVLQIENLGVEFATAGGAVRAVRDVSLTVNSGETLAIVGESGCGKSVTSLAVMGLLPSDLGRIVAGEIGFRRRDGRWDNLAVLPRAQLPDIRGNEMAMIFQEPMTSLNPLHSIGDQIAEAVRLHRRASRGEAMTQTADLLTRVGIADPARRINAYPHELSGGMRQRVMIAMALACDPILLIADEPTTALDVTIQAQIIELFQSLQDQSNMAILFITHDLGVVADVADRVVVMYAGEIIEEGDVAEVLKHPLHPYTKGLIASVPRIDRPQRGTERFFSIPGQVPEPGQIATGCSFMPRCGSAQPGLCDALAPSMEQADHNRKVRCFRWRELPPNSYA
jgi:oligopeptide/dipeptide ABC transporter ATP-binding protein